MKKNLLFSVVCLSALLVGCKDDPPPPAEPPSTKAVVIANEGLFPSGVGTLSIYDPGTKIIEHNIFQKANVYNAGAVINSTYLDGNRLFVVVNADAVVYVINTETHVVEAKFENLGSPRHVVKVAEDRYFISDWEIQGVHVLSMKTRSINKTLPTGFGPETMLVYNDRVFIANRGGFENGARVHDSTVVAYDLTADTILATLRTGFNPNSMVLDSENNLWVLSEGREDTDQPSNSIAGELRIFNPDSLWVIDSVPFVDNLQRPEQLTVNQAGNQLYYMDNFEDANIRIHLTTDTIDKETIYISGNFYAIAADHVQDELYISDKRNDILPGFIRRYDGQKNLIQTFNAGLKPINFTFQEN